MTRDKNLSSQQNQTFEMKKQCFIKNKINIIRTQATRKYQKQKVLHEDNKQVLQKKRKIQKQNHNQCQSPDQSNSSTLQASQLSRRQIYQNIIKPKYFINQKWDILPEKDYNIFGDIFIETDFVSEKKYSTQNYWKPPLNVQVTYDGIIKMDIGNFGKTLKDFLIISNLMKLCKHDQILEFAQKLEQWQTLSKQILIMQKPKDDLIYERLSNRFDTQSDFLIKRLNEENKMFIYSKKRFNYVNKNLEEYQFGFNQLLLAALGIEQDQIGSVIMRNGRLNNFDIKSRFKISQQLLNNYLNLTKNENEMDESLQNINIITFDNFKVPAKAISQCFSYNQICGNDEVEIMDYEFVIQIIEVDFSIQSLQEIANLREFGNGKDFKFEELKDYMYYYDCEKFAFIKKFYQ